MSQTFIALLAAAIVAILGFEPTAYAGPLDEKCLAPIPDNAPDFIPRDVRLNLLSGGQGLRNGLRGWAAEGGG